MAKFCIFCGEKPQEKNKEHVVPQWLIRLTGDPKRNAFFGYNFVANAEMKARTFAFDQLTFPACRVCNETYGALEVKIQAILTKLLNDDSVTTQEMSLFFDWLDKVRVGLWLGMLQLDKTYDEIAPNFHISTRIAQYDRMCIIEKSDASKDKLNFGGADNLSFTFTPSAFVLIVNNYYFTNISYLYLLHRRLGFPFPQDAHYVNDGERVESNFLAGQKRIMKPLLRKPISEKGIILYQPMFKGGLVEGQIAEYDNEYVKSHSLNYEEGVGNIFQENNGKLHEHKIGASISANPQIIQDDYFLHVNSAINIREWQNWLVTLLPKTNRLSKGQAKYIKKRFNLGVRQNNHFNKVIASKLLKQQ